MKVVALVRTRDEEHNVARFCRAYSFADRILIADGGSIDRTIEIAKSFPNVEVRNFSEKVYSEDGKIWRNPEGRHINFLLDWAVEEKCDWLVIEDCDAYPTVTLQELGKSVFEDADSLGYTCIKLPRIYLYEEDKWFPQGHRVFNVNWAWKPSPKIRASELDPWGVIMENIPEAGYVLTSPYASLHDFSPTVEIGQKKLDFYTNSGKMGKYTTVLASFGKTETRESWMY